MSTPAASSQCSRTDDPHTTSRREYVRIPPARKRATAQGRCRSRDALLWVLRDLLNLTGTKYGCGIGFCGACTVHLDGEPIRSCQKRVVKVGAAQITTIEGLGGSHLHPIQGAWILEQVPQCGYCQPGQIMSAAALLKDHPVPTDSQIEQAMSGNLCRCGVYPRIRRAIRRAAQERTS